MASNPRPQSEQEARAMARKMCEEHWGPEKKPFHNVPWEWGSDFTFVSEAQDEIGKYLTKHKIWYEIQECFPGRFIFDD